MSDPFVQLLHQLNATIDVITSRFRLQYFPDLFIVCLCQQSLG